MFKNQLRRKPLHVRVHGRVLPYFYFHPTKSQTFEYFEKFSIWLEQQTGQKTANHSVRQWWAAIHKNVRVLCCERHSTPNISAIYTFSKRNVRTHKSNHNESCSNHANRYLGPEFWCEAAECAAFTLNRTLNHAKSNKSSPYEVVFCRKPSTLNWKVFRQHVYYHVHKEQRNGKLADRAAKAVFLGYPEASKAYRLYDFNKKRIIISRDVTFLPRHYVPS